LLHPATALGALGQVPDTASDAAVVTSKWGIGAKKGDEMKDDSSTFNNIHHLPIEMRDLGGRIGA